MKDHVYAIKRRKPRTLQANVYLQTGLFLRIREKGGVFRLVMVDKDSKTRMVWPINESYDSLANALSGANDLLVKLGCFTDLDK